MTLTQLQHPQPSPQQLRAPRVTAAVLATMCIFTTTPAVASDYPKRYEVVRDTKGQQVATVECDGVTSQCIIRDTRGRRTGTVNQEPVEQEQEQQEPTLEEIIEETRHPEPERFF